MKNALLGLVLVLQLGTLALVGGEALRRRQQKEEASEFDKLESTLRNLSAALHQQRQFNDQLRRQLDQQRSASAAPATADPTEPTEAAGMIGPSARPEEQTLGGAEAIERLALLLEERAEAAASEEAVLSPFDERIEQARSRLLSHGLDALYWLNVEVTRQPYDGRRDPRLIEYLLNEVLPPLSELDREGDAFDIARDALLTVTNENVIRLAGARALQQIEPEKWQKEYADVIRHGGTRNRDVTLRLALMNDFALSPWKDAVALCQAFIADVRAPIALRTKSVQVLSKQDSPLVETTLRAALFEDPAPEIRLHSLDALNRLLAKEPMQQLLQEVVEQEAAVMHQQVIEKARLLLEGLQRPEPGQPR